MKNLLSSISKAFSWIAKQEPNHARKLRREDTTTPERLESRIAPAVILSVLDLDGDGAADDVRITGDAGKNIVHIEDNGANTLTISIDADGNGDTLGKRDLAPTNFVFSGDSVSLEVKLGAGNDVLDYKTTGNLSASARVITADLGPGTNTFSFSTGNNDVFNASRLSLDVTGGAVADAITVDFDEVRKSELAVSVAAGRGNDTVAFDADRIDDGSSVDVGVDLGLGINTLTMDFQEVGFGDHATVNADVLGGAQKDTVTLNLHDDVGNGVIASALNFKADLGAGNDVFMGNLDYAGNVFRVDDHSVASILVKGGAGNDTLSVKGVGASGTIRLDPDAHLAIDLQGGLGNDILAADLSKTDGLEVIGTLRVRLDGGLGNDILATMIANNASSTGNYDIAVLGGAGNDQVNFQAFNNGGTPTYGPTGKVVVDGGLGTDVLTSASKSLIKSTAFEQVI